MLAGDFFFVVVRGRVPIIDAAEPVDHAGGKEESRDQLRLAATAVTHESHVSDAGAVVHLHSAIPPAGTKTPYRASYNPRRASQSKSGGLVGLVGLVGDYADCEL